MLSGIFGGKSDQPMADIKSAQAYLDGLPKNNAHEMLMELTGCMEQVSDNADFRLVNQFAVLDFLDETAQPYVRKLTREYFTPNKLNKFQENHLWLVLGGFFSQAAKAHLALFKRCCNGEKGTAAIKSQEPLLAARAVYAMMGQIKYTCARYGTIDSAIWSNVAHLWRHAEQKQYLNKPFVLYKGMGGNNTTVNYELGHMLGWYGYGAGALDPLFMHLSERITNQYRSRITLVENRDEYCTFGFDLDHPSEPMRVKANVSESPSTRFISMAAMQSELEELIRALEKNIVPEYLDLGGPYGAELVYDATQHLLAYLANQPSRRSMRRGVKASLIVVNGFSDLADRTEIGLNFTEEELKHWKIENISAGGFRAVLPAQGADRIQIGNLLGIQPEGMEQWGVAVVRSLRHNDNNQLCVGAEMLASHVVGVALNQNGASAEEGGQPAIWLQTGHGELSGEILLLMESGRFSAQHSLQARLNGQNFFLLSGELQEKGIDYDLVKFHVVRLESAAEE